MNRNQLDADTAGLIEVPGGRLGYDESGHGPAVVLVHAAIGDRRGWELVVPGLANAHRVIRYDARGLR